MLRLICLLTLSVVVAASFVNAQNTASITGTALNENGATLAHANLCTSVSSGSHTTINCRYSVDSEGHFDIQNIGVGTYGVFAINEDEGYSIDNQSPGVKVTLTPENPSQNITVHLRPRGAIVTGSVSDRISGKVIEDAWINYIAIDDGGGGGNHKTSGGRFTMAVPTSSNLLIYVSAHGYKGWVCTDSSSSAQPVVRLAPGERRVLDIELEPLTKSSAAF